MAGLPALPPGSRELFPEDAHAEPVVAVLLPLPLAGAYDYKVPAGMARPAVGTLVRVPLGRREEIGVVWGA
ncbi:hypothetical protein CCR92_06275, partial [Rhodospirillum rubrum]|nr:hypothetical protein [Rhodospirillum rubrum]